LPEVPLEMPTSAIGKNTSHAIQAGVVMGYEGLIRHLVGKIKEELAVPCKVWATGGLAEKMTALSDFCDAILPTLTLDGLRLIAAHFSTQK
jgi:type III pantothenate kinase